MLQEVLLADWQEVWHSPQPPFTADSTRFLVSKVWILFIIRTSFGFVLILRGFIVPVFAFSVNSLFSVLQKEQPYRNRQNMGFGEKTGS